jgi:hypothetical protein
MAAPSIILINGPRGVGKDTAALAIKGKRDDIAIVPVMRVAKRIAIYEANLDAETWFDLFETLKDTPFAELDGRTPRQLYIDYGNKARARSASALASLWKNEVLGGHEDAGTVIVPDVRFIEEFFAALKIFKPADVLMLRIKRPGATWDGDIGSYFDTSSIVWGHRELTIDNDLDLAAFRDEAMVIGYGFICRRRLANERKSPTTFAEDRIP